MGVVTAGGPVERPGAGTPGAAASRPGGRAEPAADEVSLIELATVLLKRWKLVVGLPFVVAVVTAVVVLLLPNRFTAMARFVPETEAQGVSLPAGLSGLASQFGVSLPAGASGSSPAFYAEVLRSRTLRDAVLQAGFPDPRAPAPTDSATLLDLLGIEGESLEERLAAGRKKMEGMVSVRVDGETSIVDVSVETRHAALSAHVANYLVTLLSRFNLETRQSQAQQRREFIEARLDAAEAELRAAEEDLKGFLERNRQFDSSPELRFQHDRLERQLRIKEEVFTTLRRQYEEARIQEVNDTPVITLVDRAVPPQRKSSPKRRLTVIVAAFLGGLLGVFGAFGRELVDRAREQDEEEYREFSSRWDALKAELRSLVRRR